MKPPPLPPKKKLCNLTAEKKRSEIPNKSNLRRATSLPNVVDFDVTFTKGFRDINMNPIEDEPTYDVPRACSCATSQSSELESTHTTSESDESDRSEESDTSVFAQATSSIIVPSNGPVSPDHIYDTVPFEGSLHELLNDPWDSEPETDQRLLRHSSQNVLRTTENKADEPRVFRWCSLNPPIEPPMPVEAILR